MRWRVVIESTRGDGAIHCHEVFRGNDDSSGSAVSPLGLTLADAKAVPAGSDEGAVRFGKQHDHPRVLDGLILQKRFPG
jgi:hypothetical protein